MRDSLIGIVIVLLSSHMWATRTLTSRYFDSDSHNYLDSILLRNCRGDKLTFIPYIRLPFLLHIILWAWHLNCSHCGVWSVIVCFKIISCLHSSLSWKSLGLVAVFCMQIPVIVPWEIKPLAWRWTQVGIHLLKKPPEPVSFWKLPYTRITFSRSLDFGFLFAYLFYRLSNVLYSFTETWFKLAFKK